MLFNSLQFLIFFPIVCVLTFLAPKRTRWIVLLVASYVFYMGWRAEYALLLVLSTVVDYFVAREISRTDIQLRRRLWLALSLSVNLGVLFTFKYYNFFLDSAQAVLGTGGLVGMLPTSQLLLPVGISFYTFQTMGYTIDVYRGVKEPEYHFGIFGLYVAFFPQLVAGPIERSTHLLPQFHRELPFDTERLTSGLRQMLWGFFKKLVVADRLAIVVNQVYSNPEEYSWVNLLIATVFFAYQIYCDFSGYSDIAIGAARILGYDLMENFNLPYYSRSIREFWSRWHISLSTWFRDYLYIPLGGNRVSTTRWYFNVMTVFLVSGLWHGANWTFVIWGAIHGVVYISELLIEKQAFAKRMTQRMGKESIVLRVGQIALTFAVVTFAWIFFRANSVSDALYVARHIIGFSMPSLEVSWEHVRLGILAIALLEVQQLYMAGAFQPLHRLAGEFRWARWSYDYFVIFAILTMGVFSQQQFIYFQF